jgi:PilZ domain
MTNEGQFTNQRQHRRFRTRGVIRFAHAGTNHKARVENISLGGVRAALVAPLPVGTELLVEIPLPKEQLMFARAEVVHSNSGGAGLRFLWSGEGDPNCRLLQELIGG